MMNLALFELFVSRKYLLDENRLLHDRKSANNKRKQKYWRIHYFSFCSNTEACCQHTVTLRWLQMTTIMSQTAMIQPHVTVNKVSKGITQNVYWDGYKQPQRGRLLGATTPLSR